MRGLTLYSRRRDIGHFGDCFPSQSLVFYETVQLNVKQQYVEVEVFQSNCTDNDFTFSLFIVLVLQLFQLGHPEIIILLRQ